jgi:hypothetical protein
MKEILNLEVMRVCALADLLEREYGFQGRMQAVAMRETAVKGRELLRQDDPVKISSAILQLQTWQYRTATA